MSAAGLYPGTDEDRVYSSISFFLDPFSYYSFICFGRPFRLKFFMQFPSLHVVHFAPFPPFLVLSL